MLLKIILINIILSLIAIYIFIYSLKPQAISQKILENTSISQYFPKRILQEEAPIYNQYIYTGTWQSQSIKKDILQFNYLDQNKGNSYFFIEYENNIAQNIYMYYYNPQYTDEKFVFAIVNLSQCQLLLDRWICVKNYVKWKKYDKKYYKGSGYVQNATIIIRIQNSDIPQQTTFLISLEYQNQINLKGQYQAQTSSSAMQVALYNVYMSFIGLLQLFCVWKFAEYLQRNEIRSTKLSLITIGFVSANDCYLALCHIYLSIQNTFFLQYFIITAIIYFVLASIYDMKLLIIIWKNRYYVNYNTPQEIRKGFILFYAKFYLSLIVIILLNYYFYLFDIYLYFLPLFIIPQIIHNYMKGNQVEYNFYYIFGILFLRVIEPIYIRGCPENIFGYAPHYQFCIIWTSLFIIQIFFIYLQYKLGPRFFIPRRFRVQYNYFHTVNFEDR
ncbi:zinc finger protein, putative [Ichthyophthirius multifiliis]|uniref:RING-type E3 ubiquitin transferase n=1 Tax=Ichthyophthirius multifiliis TaxID=5932 RepID=G0QLA4_ICHMU|nr:zinc finger protein, putative [Ichthyophthirius multifiliis]EGR34005.1 zinc finger protein, putative [Ichthyophthirius multifiliis]|eukprot:XP_004039309.1 zinc finger protein, putative [Ichthyophthirius multifiliis]